MKKEDDPIYIDVSNGVCPGNSLDDIYHYLKFCSATKECPVKAKFNGSYIYSDENIDEVYKTVTGKSKAEFDDYLNKQEKEYKQKQENAKSRVSEWIEKGHKAFAKDKWADWDKCVPIRAGDLYCGMELDNVLEINNILKTNDKNRFQNAKDYMDSQGHSGSSWSLVCALIKAFCEEKDGKELVEFLNK